MKNPNLCQIIKQMTRTQLSMYDKQVPGPHDLNAVNGDRLSPKFSHLLY